MKYLLTAITTLLAILAVSAEADSSEASPVAAELECVVLLHGLARTPRSMTKLAAELTERGYRVVNDGYPSRHHSVADLAEETIPAALENCDAMGATHTHFVTHSMGGILVRYYLSQHQVEDLGRVVMLSPPNQGSEVVDKLGEVPGYYALNGPAGMELGTGEDALPQNLGPVDYDVGVITGNRSINWILSMLIPGPDDGKVAVERARLAGMKDFLVLPHTHPMIMRSERTIDQTLFFLQHGHFDHAAAKATAENSLSAL